MDSAEQIQAMLQCKIWAVVGATENPEKFGYKIYKLLREAGYKVYPVNLALSYIEGARCYPSLTSLPERPNAVSIVVSPKIGEMIIEECVEQGIKNVWLQPGANADNVVEAAKKAGLNTIHESCVLVEVRKQNPNL